MNVHFENLSLNVNRPHNVSTQVWLASGYLSEPLMVLMCTQLEPHVACRALWGVGCVLQYSRVSSLLSVLTRAECFRSCYRFIQCFSRAAAGLQMSDVVMHLFLLTCRMMLNRWKDRRWFDVSVSAAWVSKHWQTDVCITEETKIWSWLTLESVCERKHANK